MRGKCARIALDGGARAAIERRRAATMASFHSVRALRTWWRNSPWVVISIGAHVIVLSVLAITYVAQHKKVDEPIQTAVLVVPRVRPQELLPEPPPIVHEVPPQHIEVQLTPA